MTANVLLIGNGPSALRFLAGAEIDAFDGVVARFNDFRTEGFEPHVGARTDEWVTWNLFEGPAAREYDRVLCVARPPAETWPLISARYPHARKLSDGAVVEAQRLMGYHEPSSGAYTAMQYVLEGRRVFLYGFDFFQTRKHHYSDSAEPGLKHKPHHEREFFARLLAEGKVVRLREPAPDLADDPAAPAEVRELRAWSRALESDRDQLVDRAAQLVAWAATLEADRDRVVQETRTQQEWIAQLESDHKRLSEEVQQWRRWAEQLEADRDRVVQETRTQQEWIGTVEADLKRVTEETRTQQAWIGTVEADRDRHAARAQELEARLGCVERERDGALSRAQGLADMLAGAETDLLAAREALARRVRENTRLAAQAEQERAVREAAELARKMLHERVAHAINGR